MSDNFKQLTNTSNSVTDSIIKGEDCSVNKYQNSKFKVLKKLDIFVHDKKKKNNGWGKGWRKHMYFVLKFKNFKSYSKLEHDTQILAG